MELASIALFGALGCVARYLLSGWTYDQLGRWLPYGTLAVNILGSFLLGLLMEGTLRSTLVPPVLRMGLTVGFLGGFTTFSTFSYETFRLLEDGSLLQAGLNILGNLLACLIGVWLGIGLARQL